MASDGRQISIYKWRDKRGGISRTTLGYMKVGDENKVLKLKKALYGLKQAPWAWNARIDTYFKENGFKQCPFEHPPYVKKGEFIVCSTLCR